MPITRTKSPGLTSTPTAPIWQSKAPTATATLVVRPSLSAHSGVRLPTLTSLGKVSSNNLKRYPASRGSSVVRKSSDGSPPHDSCHIALCPAAHLLLSMVSGFVLPVIRAGNQSHTSTQEYAAFRTFSSSLNICSIFAHTHSDEYMPPSYAV